MTQNVEAWLNGPVEGVPPLLQPVAHSLLQVRHELGTIVVDLPSALLWTRPQDVASAGFHLRHMAGVVDRLFTYARGEPLDEVQRTALANEKTPDPSSSADDLLQAFHHQVDRALEQLKQTPESSLTDRREVGRARLPSTVMGLLFHAAEHTQRHLGQLLVTVRLQVPIETVD